MSYYNKNNNHTMFNLHHKMLRSETIQIIWNFNRANLLILIFNSPHKLKK